MKLSFNHLSNFQPPKKLTVEKEVLVYIKHIIEGKKQERAAFLTSIKKKQLKIEHSLGH